MASGSAITLSDVLAPSLTIVCEPYSRRGACSVRQLMNKHGDARLPNFLSLLSANCPKRTANKITDICNAKFDWLDGPPRPRGDR
jgi:hypothetical protein